MLDRYTWRNKVSIFCPPFGYALIICLRAAFVMSIDGFLCRRKIKSVGLYYKSKINSSFETLMMTGLQRARHQCWCGINIKPLHYKSG